jgi:hypothetical protein
MPSRWGNSRSASLRVVHILELGVDDALVATTCTCRPSLVDGLAKAHGGLR